MGKYWKPNYVDEDNAVDPPEAEFQPTYGAKCLEDLFGSIPERRTLRAEMTTEAARRGAVTVQDFAKFGVPPRYTPGSNDPASNKYSRRK